MFSAALTFRQTLIALLPAGPIRTVGIPDRSFRGWQLCQELPDGSLPLIRFFTRIIHQKCGDGLIQFGLNAHCGGFFLPEWQKFIQSACYGAVVAAAFHFKLQKFSELIDR